MKVTLIRAGLFPGRSHDAMKPGVFRIAAALLPENVQLDCYDDRIEALPERIESDIIAISTDTFSARRAYLLAKKYKRKYNLIVLGGFHPTVCPEEAGTYADVVMMGDAEATWPPFFSDIKQGTVKSLYDGTKCSQVPMAVTAGNDAPYYGKRYIKVGMIQFSRGCKFHCDFCSVKSMYPGVVRQKSLTDLIAEIKSTKEKLLFFVDDNLFLDEGSARKLFLAVKPLKKKWACQISLEVAKNANLLKLMKESGCILVLIGFESLKKENLLKMNKQANLETRDYEAAIQTIYAQGIMIYGTFVLGYDGDTTEDARIIMEFALQHNMAVANFNPLIPMPGTALYSRLQSEGRLLYNGKWWLDDTYHYGDTAFLPVGMTPEELRDCCRKVRYEYYNFRNILKRAWRLKIHRRPYGFFVYMMLNLVSALEIRRKQGRLLGGDTR